MSAPDAAYTPDDEPETTDQANTDDYGFGHTESDPGGYGNTHTIQQDSE